jgi:hypothetical protein
MAVTQTIRFGLHQWSAGTDPLTRLQITGDMLTLGNFAAGWQTGTLAARPAAAGGNTGFFYWATDVGRLYYSDGAAWFAAAGRATLAGFLGVIPNATTGPVQAYRVGVDAGGGISAGLQRPIVAACPGSIVGVAAYLEAARTAGTLTFEVYKNGVATGLTAVIDGTNPQSTFGTQAPNVDTFAAGDLLDVRWTTAGFAPITNPHFETTIDVVYG